MKTKTLKPSWWMLYVLLIGMMGLILLESQDGASNSAHVVIDGIIVVGFFGSLLAWMHINASALERDELEHASLSEYHVTEYEPTQPASSLKDSPSAPNRAEDGKSHGDEGAYVLFPVTRN